MQVCRSRGFRGYYVTPDFDRIQLTLFHPGGLIMPTTLLLPPRILDPPTALTWEEGSSGNEPTHSQYIRYLTT